MKPLYWQDGKIPKLQKGAAVYLFWKIRYFDRNEKKFKDRNLGLDTAQLEPATKAAIELLVETRTRHSDRTILKFRSLFQEVDSNTLHAEVERTGSINGVPLENYHEDENGEEISLDEIGVILTGNPNARFIRSGYEQHDIEYMNSESIPVPVDTVSLSIEDIGILGYFCRDLKELSDSAFMKDGPGSIHAGGSLPEGQMEIKTAVSDDEIRSFVTIFRRLYMQKEPANFLKAVDVFCKAINGHPLAAWVKGLAESYEQSLSKPPYCPMSKAVRECQFSKKRLIDVFLYTQYAHQPDERRQRQYRECLTELEENEPLLFWLFLSEIWGASLKIGNGGKVMNWWFRQYCETHQVTADVLDSIRLRNPGLGELEKVEAKRQRVFQEKSQQLAGKLWEQHGCPSGGPILFLHEAEKQLRELLG